MKIHKNEKKKYKDKTIIKCFCEENFRLKTNVMIFSGKLKLL